MLTIDQILKVAKFRSSYPNEGSCFGVTDPSRLRGYTQSPSAIEFEDTSKYSEGKEYMELYSHWSNFMQIKLVDKELCNGYKARVSINMSGTPEAKEDWTKDKIPFSDLETKSLQYIVKVFD